MALEADDIASHPALHRAVQEQSRALIEIFERTPRLAAVFATQQRWLMGHVGLALHFRRDPHDRHTALTLARFIKVIRENAVASRNTAEAFIKEMLHYNIAEYVSGGDGRTHPLQPTAATVQTFTGWVLAHLQTLDQLDGGDRLTRFLERPEMVARLQPLVADVRFAMPAEKSAQQREVCSLVTFCDTSLLCVRVCAPVGCVWVQERSVSRCLADPHADRMCWR